MAASALLDSGPETEEGLRSNPLLKDSEENKTKCVFLF